MLRETEIFQLRSAGQFTLSIQRDRRILIGVGSLRTVESHQTVLIKIQVNANERRQSMAIISCEVERQLYALLIIISTHDCQLIRRLTYLCVFVVLSAHHATSLTWNRSRHTRSRPGAVAAVNVGDVAVVVGGDGAVGGEDDPLWSLIVVGYCSIARVGLSAVVRSSRWIGCCWLQTQVVI